MLFVELQRKASELKLLQFDEGLLSNPITASKNISNDICKLDVDVQLPGDTKPYYRAINLFVRFLMSVPLILFQKHTFYYLKQNEIYV